MALCSTKVQMGPGNQTADIADDVSSSSGKASLAMMILILVIIWLSNIRLSDTSLEKKASEIATCRYTIITGFGMYSWYSVVLCWPLARSSKT